MARKHLPKYIAPLKTKSLRNTGFNGIDNSGGRWKSHVNDGSDTFTQAGLFQIQGRGFDKVQDLLESAGFGVNRMADDLVAKAGKEGRKEATKIEEQIFNLGKVWEHSNIGDPQYLPGGVQKKIWKSSSKYSSTLGGYIGKSSSGHSLRLINFHFNKNSIAERKPMLTPAVASVKVTSQLANLFENKATWRSNSPYWRMENGLWRNYMRGATRRGKHYFGRFYSAFDKGLDKAIPDAEKSFKRYMNKSYLKAK